MTSDRFKILYLMPVPWGWIKQRPHFIAEQLSKSYRLTVCWRKAYRRNRLVSDAAISMSQYRSIFVLPFERFIIIDRLNQFLVKKQISKLITSYEIVWISHPKWYEFIKEVLPKKSIVIYDCMDDALEFPKIKSNESLRSRTHISEKEMIARCNIVLASSDNLKFKLQDRYGYKHDIYVINNAIELSDMQPVKDEALPLVYKHAIDSSILKKIVYIGTIDEWIDFELIMNSLRDQENITYIFIGPLVSPMPGHDRIVYIPPVDHRLVFSIMLHADALIMPFVVNDLIRSVNPVKLYEYIHSCKPVISVASDEVERFGDYIYTYSDRTEFTSLIARVANGTLSARRSCEDCRSFAALHTWDARMAAINAVIDESIAIKTAFINTESNSEGRPTPHNNYLYNKNTENDPIAKLPNFFIVGAARAGTTSISKYLKQHPQVYMSPVKEPHYFSSDIDISSFKWQYRSRFLIDIDAYFDESKLKELHTAHITEWEQYCKLFRNAGNAKAIGEASVSYLYSGCAAKNIREKLPNAKIVILLRNPVERAFSHYLTDLRDGYTTLSFRKALEKDLEQKKKGWGVSHLYVELGMYYEQVRRYLDLFPKDNVKIYLYDEFGNLRELLHDLFRFLDIDRSFLPDISTVHNRSRMPKNVMINAVLKGPISHLLKGVLPTSYIKDIKKLLLKDVVIPQMHMDDRRRLNTIFHKDIEKLSGLLGKDLSSWLSPLCQYS